MFHLGVLASPCRMCQPVKTKKMNLDNDLRDERDGPGHAEKDRERK